VTRGQLPQRAGSPGLNGDGTAAVVPRINAITLKNIMVMVPFTPAQCSPIKLFENVSLVPKRPSWHPVPQWGLGDKGPTPYRIGDHLGALTVQKNMF